MVVFSRCATYSVGCSLFKICLARRSCSVPQSLRAQRWRWSASRSQRSNLSTLIGALPAINSIKGCRVGSCHQRHWGIRLVFISQILGKYRNKHVLNSYNLWIQCIRENIYNAANGDDQNMILSFGIFDQKTVTILYVFISIFTRYLG